jgi:hypothetical protein
MNLDKLLTEEIKRYQELMGHNSEILNEVFNPNVFAKGLSRFARGAARNVLDNVVTKEIKSGVNKAFKNTTSAFFSDIISGAKKLDDFATKVKPQEVSDNIIKGLRKQGYVLTNLEEMALRKEVQTSINKTVKGTSSRLRMFKKSFNSAELAEFNRLKAGKNLTDDQLLKLARKSKGAKVKPITNPIDNQIDNQIDNTVDNSTSGIKSKFQKVKEAWKKIGIWWNGLSRAQRRFYRVAGLILGVSLLAWLYSVLSKEGYCKCLLNMMQDSDAEYMDSVSMDDAMFLGKTGNSEIDGQGGGIFYGDGKFKSKNGRMQGSYTCNDEGVFINVAGAKYQLKCAGGIEELLPIPVDPDDTTNTGKTDTIVYKDCEGPEYQLGCTDKGDTIERVQACLKLPVTGKFDKDLENALVKKIGKKTFTEQDVFIICDVKSTTKFTFG